MTNENKIFGREFVIAILLTCAGGFLEAYSLYYRGFWGMMMTGNLVYATNSLVSGDFTSLITYIPVIIFFMIGVILGKIIEKKLAKGDKNRYQVLELLILLANLLIIVAIPTIYDNIKEMADKTSAYNIISNCLLAVGGGLLSASFTSFDGQSYAPTMMTANLSRLSIGIHDWIFGENKKDGRLRSFKYLILILTFLTSEGSCFAFYYYIYAKRIEGESFVSYFPNVTLLLPIILILISMILIINKNKKEAKANLNNSENKGDLQ